MSISTLAIAADKIVAIGDLIMRYELSNRADGKSLKTITWYTELLKSFSNYLKWKQLPDDLATFNLNTIRDYILYLRQKPRFDGHPYIPSLRKPLSPRTIQCHVRCLKAFSSWLFREGSTEVNRLQNLKLPKAPATIVQPLTEAEKDNILIAIETKTFTGMRNHAVMVTLLDTGLRASEVVNARKGDVNLDAGHIKVMGKGSKERMVPIGSYVQKVIWRYLERAKDLMPIQGCDLLFVTKQGKPITVNTVKLIFSRLAKKTGITRLHAHLCRHTFAVNYLLNGGDVFSLQEIMGHTTLEMVRHYLHFTSAQIAVQHHKFSPMDKWASSKR